VYVLQPLALPRLCSQLWVAEGLRELVLELEPGRAVRSAVSARLAYAGILTQLSSLQLRGVALTVEGEQLVAALSPLTGLTRLNLRFDCKDDLEDVLPAFPWGDAVCGLTRLLELRVTTASASEDTEKCANMFKGAFPAALSRLAALRHLEVLGMNDQDAGSNELQLSGLPTLETAALRLHTLSYRCPGLLLRQQVVLSRLVSLSLALRVDINAADPSADTWLPAIVAPALTELVLNDIRLALDSKQLSWLPRLPKLRRLELKDVKTASDQLPQGVMGCSGLTELVMQHVVVSSSSKLGCWLHGSKSRLRSLLAAGPYLSQLICIDLSRNAFRGVPLSLAAATALQELSLSEQQPRRSGASRHAAAALALEVLEELPHLRRVNLQGFKDSGLGIRRFREACPDVSITI